MQSSLLSKLIILGSFCLLLVVGVVSVSLYLAETVFFDRFYYNKSIAHGYWPPNLGVTEEDFGKRSEHIVQLHSYRYALESATAIDTKETSLEKHVVAKKDGVFRVIIIGDSYVWGQGLRDKQRFSSILDKKLNKIRDTEVITLGYPGDNIFDYYAKYLLSREVYPDADIYVFGLVNNDLKLNEFHKYDSTLMHSLNSSCKNLTSVYSHEHLINTLQIPKILNNSYLDVVEMSFEKATKNWCMFEELIPLLPSNAMYIDLETVRWPDHYQNTGYGEFIKELRDSGLKVFDVMDKLPNRDEDILPKDTYSVSATDQHPSKDLNMIYANVIFEETSNNSQWNFLEKE